MTYEVIGLKTKRVYARGSRPFCMRAINDGYPYTAHDTNTSFWTVNPRRSDAVFKEPLRIIRRNKHETLG